MLKRIKQLYKKTLGASDGDIGHVKDFYFDDWDWAVRYVVADTGSWLSELLVLISPRAIGGIFKRRRALARQFDSEPNSEQPLDRSAQARIPAIRGCVSSLLRMAALLERWGYVRRCRDLCGAASPDAEGATESAQALQR